jgi:hypothetical protein
VRTDAGAELGRWAPALGGGVWRRSTASWWPRTRISSSLAAPPWAIRRGAGWSGRASRRRASTAPRWPPSHQRRRHTTALWLSEPAAQRPCRSLRTLRALAAQPKTVPNCASQGADICSSSSASRRSCSVSTRRACGTRPLDLVEPYTIKAERPLQPHCPDRRGWPRWAILVLPRV